MIIIKAFGGLEVRDEARGPITALLAQPKRSALLAYLVLAHAGGYCRRDTLLALFWPDQDEEGARRALSQALTFLRRHLGSEVLVSRGPDELGVDRTQVRSDVGAFEQALGDRDWEAALAHYQGGLLEGLHVAGAAPFVDWVDRERERLREAASGAAWKQAHALIEAGRLVDAERTAQQALTLVPTDESPVRAFIEALAAAGDRAAALRFYEKFKELLARELEVEPAGETRAVVEAVREGRVVPTPGAGARLTERLPREPEREPSPDPAVFVTQPMPRTVSHRVRVTGWAIAALVPLALLAVALFRIRAAHGRGDESVIVIPIKNETGDTTLDSYVNLAADHISSGLQDVALVPVYDFRDLAGGFDAGGPDVERGLERTWPEISRPTLAVRGAFYAIGDSIEFRLQFIDRDATVRGHVLPVRGHRNDLADPLKTLQFQAARTLASIVAPDHDLAVPVGRYPPKPEAYDAFQDGWMKFGGNEYEAAIPYLKRAIEIDPHYFRPLIVLAYTYANLGRWTEADSMCQVIQSRLEDAPKIHRLETELRCPNTRIGNRTDIEVAREMARVAPAHNFGLGVRLFARNQPWEAAEAFAKYDTTIGSNAPGWEQTNALYLARTLHVTGRSGRELQMVRDVLRRFPDNEGLISREIAALIALRRRNEAREKIEDRIASGVAAGPLLTEAGREFDAHGFPDDARNAWTRALDWYASRASGRVAAGDTRAQRVELLLFLDRLPEADSLLGPLVAEYPDRFAYLGYLGVLKARMGDRDEAERISRALAEWEPSAHVLGDITERRAEIAAQLGELAEAFRLVTLAVDQGWSVRDKAHRFPFLKPLRGYPAFEQFLHPKG